MTGARNTVYEFNSMVIETNTFIQMHGLHSMTKLSEYIIQEDNEHDKNAVKGQLWQYPQGECKYQERSNIS